MIAPHLGTPGFFHNDEARHILSGAFCRDALRELPTFLADPRGYAVNWYAHFPGLVIPFYYPPLFHVVLGIAFLITGVSVTVARWVVMGFAVWTVVFAFKLVRMWADRWVALGAAILLVSIPEVACWGHSAMLELPMTAMVVTAMYFLAAYLERDRHRAIYGWAVFSALALLTKQPALFVLPASGLYVLLRRRWEVLRRREVLLSLAGVVTVVVPYMILQMEFSRVFMTVSVNAKSLSERLGWAHLTSYPRVFWGMAPATAALAVLGTWVGWRHGYRAVVLLGLAWVGGFLAFQAGISGRSFRYAVPAMPALAILGSMVLWVRSRWRPWVVGTVACSALAQAIFVATDRTTASPVIQGQFAEAAETVFNRLGGRVVLYEGYHDGEFIFHARRASSGGRDWPYVLRSSKVLYACATDPSIQFRDIRSTEQQVAELLDRTGVTHVVIEQPPQVTTAGTDALRRMIGSERFVKRGEFRIARHGSSLHDDRLEIYEYVRKTPVGPAQIVLPMPGIGRTLDVVIEG